MPAVQYALHAGHHHHSILLAAEAAAGVAAYHQPGVVGGHAAATTGTAGAYASEVPVRKPPGGGAMAVPPRQWLGDGGGGGLVPGGALPGLRELLRQLHGAAYPLELGVALFRGNPAVLFDANLLHPTDKALKAVTGLYSLLQLFSISTDVGGLPQPTGHSHQNHGIQRGDLFHGGADSVVA